jgi:hypothetical protein
MTTIQPGATPAVFAGAAAEFGASLGLFSGSMSIALGQMIAGLFQPSYPGFTAAMPASGQADINLGDGNSLRFDKSNSQMQIVDAQGNTTTVWGDPHLTENGQQIGTFYGPMTFQLQDGTKITVDTQAGTEGTGVTYADKVTITRGSNAVVVSGLDQQSAAPLSVTSSQAGYALDALTPDGLTVEQAGGGQWTNSLTGQAVSQADLNLTRSGMGVVFTFGAAMGEMLGGFLTSGLLSTSLAGAGHEAPASHGEHVRHNALQALGLGIGIGIAFGEDVALGGALTSRAAI